MSDVLTKIFADKAGTLQKMLALEKEISWTRYYWKGPEISLLVRAPSYYDPRTFEEYIDKYNSDLTNYFIYVDSEVANANISPFKKGRISDCDVVMFNDPKWKTGSYMNFDKRALSFLGGILWFNKEKLLFDYIKARYGKAYFNEELLEELVENYTQAMDTIRYYQDMLAELMPLTSKMYYCSPLEKHLWQISESSTLLVEWNKINDEYKAFQQQMMETLSNIPSLNICANVFTASSMNVSGTANINMAANCISEQSSTSTATTSTAPSSAGTITTTTNPHLPDPVSVTAAIADSGPSSADYKTIMILIIIISLICCIFVNGIFLLVFTNKNTKNKATNAPYEN
jgi:hypothetical protein